MSLVKWRKQDLFDPWTEMKRLQDEINDLFESDRLPAFTGLFDRSVSPALDIVENEDNFIVTCELPGIDQKDLDVTITSNVLTIKGEKKDGKESKEGKIYKRESWSGNFQRTLSLPNSVDPVQVNAELKNGILTLVLHKKEEAKPKQISIKIN